jgi:hypothetical protein
MNLGVWIAVGADGIALTAIIASMVISLATIRSSDNSRRATERTALRREAASVLGPVFVRLTELNPDRWMLNAGRNSA